jgi:GH15 family glucan-1,4-alpha-glucosidase
VSGRRPERADGFAPLRDYAALGDGRTAALVAADGSVDWLAMPTFDAPPLFAALVDPERGGRFTLAPAEPFSIEREYVPDTNVLRTTFHTASGTVRVTDALCVGTSGPLPWSELARRIEGLAGEVRLRWRVEPGSRFGRAQPWMHDEGGVPTVRVEDQYGAVLAFDAGEVRCEPHGVGGELVVGEGRRSLLALVVTDAQPVHLPLREQIEQRLDATVASWRRWASTICYDGPWREAVVRSALTLKLLMVERTGAITAAATTSLPERIGGDRNWDYRYAWVRDSSFALESFLELSLLEETHSAISFLVRALQRSGRLNVLYKLDGTVPDSDVARDVHARGYRDSRPVRSGNRAAGQVQFGNYGDILDSLWQYVHAGNLLDDATLRLVHQYASEVCDVWRSKDAGIWELPDEHHFTQSKIGCWVALDRAIRLVEQRGIVLPALERWRAERAAVREWIETRCWSESRHSFAVHPGTDDLDASVLLAARSGFLARDDERLDGTIDAIVSELGSGPLLYRSSAMRRAEGAFLACSFWLSDALVHRGRLDEAGELLDALVELGNDVGIYSEEADPATGAFLGNMPQALTHLSLVTAVTRFHRCASDPRRRHGAAG